MKNYHLLLFQMLKLYYVQLLIFYSLFCSFIFVWLLFLIVSFYLLFLCFIFIVKSTHVQFHNNIHFVFFFNKTWFSGHILAHQVFGPLNQIKFRAKSQTKTYIFTFFQNFYLKQKSILVILEIYDSKHDWSHQNKILIHG